MPGLRLILLFAGITLIFTVLSVLILRFTKKNLLWVLPSVVLLLTAALFFIKSRWFAQGLEDLGYLLLSIATAASGLLTFLITWLTVILHKPK